MNINFFSLELLQSENYFNKNIINNINKKTLSITSIKTLLITLLITLIKTPKTYRNGGNSNIVLQARTEVCHKSSGS